MMVLAVTAVLVTVVPKVSARYATSSSSNDSARVATFDVEIGGVQDFEQEFQITPSEDKEYTFQVTNNSEVAIDMNATFETMGNLPLEYECYKDGKILNLLSPPEESTTTAENETYTFNDKMQISEKAEYTIMITWPEENNSYKYAGGVETVKLTIEASQRD
jgi:hypothetical protein